MKWVGINDKRGSLKRNNHHRFGRTKGRKSLTTELDCHAGYYSASFPPIIKPLINSPVHREITQGLGWLQSKELSTSKWGKCLSVHLLSSLSRFFFYWYCPWSLPLLDEMPALLHLFQVTLVFIYLAITNVSHGSSTLCAEYDTLHWITPWMK